MSTNQVWHPITTDLTPSGAFSALSFFDDSEQLKPMPLAAGMVKFSEFHGREKDNELVVAASAIGGGPVIGLVHTTRLRSFEFRWIWGNQVFNLDQPCGGLIYGTRWGAGLKATVSIAESETEVTANIGLLAAKCELGVLKASLHVRMFGVSQLSYLRNMPCSVSLDRSSLAWLLKVGQRIHEAPQSDKQSWELLPYEVLLPKNYLQDPVYDALSRLFALGAIGKGKSYLAAKAEALKSATITPFQIARQYTALGIPLDDSAPSPAQQKSAQKLLK